MPSICTNSIVSRRSYDSSLEELLLNVLHGNVETSLGSYSFPREDAAARSPSSCTSSWSDVANAVALSLARRIGRGPTPRSWTVFAQKN